MISSAPRKHLRLVSSPGGSDAPAREFPVRFTPGDLLAWLHKPRNSFRWMGRGALRFDERGLEVTARRLTLLGLRRTRRLVHAAEMRDASREGNAVQINLRDGTRDAWFRFWTEGPAAAAEIVALLPTNRTVEFDNVPAAKAPSAARASTSWLLAGVAAMVLALAWMVTTRYVGAPQRAPAPKSRSAVTQALPPAARGDELQRAVSDATEAEALAAWADLEKYGRSFQGLTAQFAAAFNALLAGSVSQETFADGLELWLEPQWRTLARGLPADGPASLRTLADEQLRAVILRWERALELYAHGLRIHDPAEVNRAFLSIRMAEGHEERAQALLAELEHRREAAGKADSGAR